MINAAAYCRESPSLKENEETIASQFDSIKRRAKEDGNTLVDKYLDNGWAGDLIARPELDRLRDDAKQGKFQAVYFYDRSRMARKYWLQELITDELESLGIEVILLEEAKAQTDEERVMQAMKGVFAEYERAKITERTRRGRLYRARQGLIVGHEPLYGYKYIRVKDSQDRWFEVNNEEAEVVRKIFHWLAFDALSLRGLIKKLYKEKIHTRDGNPVWASSTLARLVRCEAYIGNFHYNKTISIVPKKPIKTVENGHYKRSRKTSREYKPQEEWFPIKIPAIIDKEVFDLAQKQLQKNLSMAHRELKYHYLLRGLIKCECGSSFAGDGAQRGHLYYRCTNRLRKFPLKKDCHAGSINAEKIETRVWLKVEKIFSDKEVLAELVSKYFKSQEQNRVGEIQLEEIEKELKLLKTEEASWMDAFGKKVIVLEQLDQRLKKIKQSEEFLNREKLKAQQIAGIPTMRPTQEYINNYSDELAKELPLLEKEEKEMFLHKVLEEILVGDKKAKIRGIIPLEPSIQNHVSKNNVSSGDRSRRSTDHSGSGHKWAKPPILHNRGPAR